jgi:hypothetical protein
MIKRLMLCLCFLNAIWSNAQSGKADFTTIDLDNDSQFIGFEKLIPKLTGKRIFFSGENHQYVAANGKLEFRLLQLMYHKAGVRNLILELGEARGYFANQYINNLDSSSLNNLMATTSPQYMQLLHDLRNWNLTLPKSARIKVHGIDVERFNDIAVLRLAEILPKEGAPEGLAIALDALQHAAGWIYKSGLKEHESSLKNNPFKADNAPFSINKSIALFVQQTDSLRPLLKQWQGDAYPAAESAINNLKEFLQWRELQGTAQEYTWREEQMFQKCVRLLNRDTAEKFYGQFGRCHVAYSEQNGDCGWFAYHSIANKLKTRYFQSRAGVLSIGVLYGLQEEITTQGELQGVRIQDEVKRLVINSPANATSIAELTPWKYPAMSARYSFVIMVKNPTAIKRKQASGFKNRNLTTIPFGFELMGYDKLSSVADHLKKNGYSTYESLPYNVGFSLGLERLSLNNYGRFLLFSGLNMTLAENESMYLRYNSRGMSMELGKALINKPGWLLLAGISGFYATQRLTAEKRTADFLTLDLQRKKVMSNQAWGPGINTCFKSEIKHNIWLSIRAGYQRDLSDNNWFLSKSNLYYAHKRLETQYSGFSLGFMFNFVLQ